MPLVLRSIRKANWYNSPALSWLGADDVQSDALGDLNTRGNRLSLYLIDDQRERLEHVAVALATTKDFFKEVDYALFDHKLIEELGIAAVNIEGTTPDTLVNGWHLELVELTVDRVNALVQVIRNRGTLGRILPKRIKLLTTEAVRANRLDRTRMKPKMQSSVDSLLGA